MCATSFEISDYLEKYIDENFKDIKTKEDAKKRVLDLSNVILKLCKKVDSNLIDELCRKKPLFSDALDLIFADSKAQSSKSYEVYLQTFKKGFSKYCFDEKDGDKLKVRGFSYFKEPREHLSTKEFRELLKRYKENDESAMEELVRANIDLVSNVCLNDSNIRDLLLNESIDLDDAIQEGIIGLIKAIKSYDETRSSKFSTYAFYVIKQAIVRNLIETAEEIRTPINQRPIYYKMKSFIENYYERYGTYPSLERLSVYMNMKKNTIYSLLTSKDIVHVESEEFDENSATYDFEDEVLTRISNLKLRESIKDRLTDTDSTIIFARMDGLSQDEAMDLIDEKMCRQNVNLREKSALKKIKGSEFIENYSYLAISPDDFVNEVRAFRRKTPKQKELVKVGFKS